MPNLLETASRRRTPPGTLQMKVLDMLMPLQMMLVARIKSPTIPFSKLLLPSPIPSGPAPHNNEDLFTRSRPLVAC